MPARSATGAIWTAAMPPSLAAAPRRRDDGVVTRGLLADDAFGAAIGHRKD